MWFKDHIKDLTAEQIIELDYLINIEQSKLHMGANSNTEEARNLICVHCGSSHTKKHGKVNGKQRYICKDCRKTFNRLTGTILNHSRLTNAQWKELLFGITENFTYSKIAKNVEISKSAAWINKQKICHAISKLYGEQDKFTGIAECDEYYVPVSFKGKRDPKFFLNTLGRMPRHHYTREQKIEWLKKAGVYDELKKNPQKLREVLYSGETKLRGISRDQTCILTCQDRSGNLYINPVCVGRLETDDVKKGLEGHFEGDAILVTDSHNAYPPFAKTERIQLEQIEADRHAKGPFNLGRINALHADIARYWPKHQERVPSIKYIDLSLMAFQWLRKNNDMQTNEKVGKLYDIIQDRSLCAVTSYSKLKNRKLALNTKLYFPNKV